MKCKIVVELPEEIAAGQLWEILEGFENNYALESGKKIEFADGWTLGFPDGCPVHTIRRMVGMLPGRAMCRMPWNYERKLYLVYDDGVEVESEDVPEVEDGCGK